ncbi:oxidoreductase [Ectobacillus ponti]|uniref:Oxidoreductase n=1 Tax=Ectobacillus ponti TaxID=2961894 RepID=A0AA41X8C0_9BACI|nr:oxidoreductase [Ectobacillus ponti]MCP8970754.1 oxidoreductase [Ectobacillus ponti]
MTKVAIVTGANSGFGLLTAVELAKRGFHVVAAMRAPAKQDHLMAAAAAAGVQLLLQVEQLDVTEEESVARFSSILPELGRVDVLVNNAGYAVGGFAEEVMLAEYRQQFETNVFGVIAMTQAVLPFMRRQRSGTIVNVSSISGLTGFPGLSPYVASKHALEGWSECLRLEVKPFGVQVALVEPGSYQTNIWTSGKQVAAASLQPASPYYESMNKIEAHLDRGRSSFGNPLEVALKIADLATAKRTSLRNPIGSGLQLFLFAKALLPWSWWERLVLSRLK